MLDGMPPMPIALLMRDLLTPFHYGDIPALAKTNFGG